MEQYLAGFDELLTRLASAQDSDTIRNATATLNTDYYSKSDCVPALVEIIGRSPHFHVRQLAAVELRKRINKQWEQVPKEHQVAIRNQLLQLVLVEQHELVRHSIARVISTVAYMDIRQNEWPDLLVFLNQSCVSDNVLHREVGTFILYTLIEVLADFFMTNSGPLFDLLVKALSDPESKKVRVTSVSTIGKLSEFLDPDENRVEIEKIRDLVPTMVNILGECLKEDDDEGAGEIFEVFDTFLMLDLPILSTHLVELIRFFLSIGANKEVSEGIRVMALTFLMWAAVYKQNKIRSLKLVGFIVEGLMPIGTEEDPEDVDEDSPSRLAFKVLNALATNMPPQQVYPIVMQTVAQYAQSPDPNFRKAAMMAFAVIIDGCSEYMSNKLNEILPLVCNGLQDGEIIVRRAACMALGCLAEELQVGICEHHQVLLPLVFTLMSDAHPEVTRHACNALDAILEGLGSEVVQYLPMLMDRLLVLLDHSKHTETRATVIAAIGSAAHAAGKEFTPYFVEIIPRMRLLMSLKDTNDQLLLRGVATDTVGSIAEAVGADKFRHCTQDFMGLAIEQLQLGDSRLKECAYAFFSILARVFGEEFAPYLPTIMPPILASCEADDPENGVHFGQIDASEDADEDLDDEDGAGVRFNSAIADEKEFAVDALGELFKNTRTHFLPYVDAAVAQLSKLGYDLMDGVRKATTGSLFAFLRTFYVISGGGEWTRGLPVSYPVHENVEHMINVVMPHIIAMWNEEWERMVVVQMCQELIEALKLIGPAVISECSGEISRFIIAIFEKKSLCQQDYDDDDYVDEDDEAESESLLISAAADLAGTMCEVLGEGFSSYFDVLLPLISKYYKKTKSVPERTMAIACLAECVHGIESAVTPHTERLLQLFIKACADQDATVRRNAAYGLGLLAIHSQIDLSSQYPVILTALYPLFHDQEVPSTKDNGVAAVARLILAHPEAMPLDQVLPVFTASLPLKVDFDENDAVFDCIFQLFRANNPYVFNNIPQYLHVFHYVLTNEGQISDLKRAQIVDLVRALHAQKPDLNLGASELAPFLQ